MEFSRRNVGYLWIDVDDVVLDTIGTACHRLNLDPTLLHPSTTHEGWVSSGHETNDARLTAEIGRLTDSDNIAVLPGATEAIHILRAECRGMNIGYLTKRRQEIHRQTWSNLRLHGLLGPTDPLLCVPPDAKKDEFMGGRDLLIDDLYRHNRSIIFQRWWSPHHVWRFHGWSDIATLLHYLRR